MASTIAGALFAAIDEALVALGEARAQAAASARGPDAETAARFVESRVAIHSRMMTGRIMCLVVTAVMGYELALTSPTLWGRVVWLGATALFYATVVGIATTLAARRASRLALPMLRYARPLELAVTPFSAPLILIGRLLERLWPPRPEDAPERVTGIVVGHMIEQGEKHGSIAEEDAELLKSVLEFRETVAREVMVPRTSMVSIDATTSVRDVIKLIIEKGHSRYPVYSGTIDRPIGILYAKDLFAMVERDGGFEGKLESLVRGPVFYSAESQRISELLRQMQARRVHLAIVVDEYGGTSGMVTLEDIIEEIVGEIRDEHDPEDMPVQQIAPGRYMANADVSVHDLAEITGLQLPEGVGDYESLGGMLIDLAGKVPASGESIEIGDHDLIIRAADERHVTRVEVVDRQQYPPAAE